jgi:type IV pilus assembly protein PilV
MQRRPHPTSLRPRRRGQAGITMIEFLVSILIFAFGMLGLVGMQTKTLAYSQISLYRSQAMALSDDILDRMRADRSHAKAGDWSTDLDDASDSFTGTTVAQTDLKEWKAEIENLLPGGRGQIAFEATPNRVIVTIDWLERDSTNRTVFTTVSAL